MHDFVKSTIGGSYDPQDVIAIRDRHQSYLYIKNGSYPVDIYVSNDDLVMVFQKNEQTRELYRKWRAHELN